MSRPKSRSLRSLAGVPRRSAMRLLIAIAPWFALTLVAGCAKPGDYPSLAPRAAEAIDPRVPIVADPSPGTVEPRVASALTAAVARARGGRGEFDRLARRAEALAGAAGASIRHCFIGLSAGKRGSSK